jgi:hypothetical protein
MVVISLYDLALMPIIFVGMQAGNTRHFTSINHCLPVIVQQPSVIDHTYQSFPALFSVPDQQQSEPICRPGPVVAQQQGIKHAKCHGIDVQVLGIY